MSERSSVGATHYDRVTAAWAKWIMGQELHFGLFEHPGEELSTATRRLTEHLIELGDVGPTHALLDVGCGIGTQARVLAGLGCKVTGISTSKVGLTQARRAARREGLAIEFLERDAMANGLESARFDRVWVMESAHVMPDKRLLFSECARVTVPGGRLVLCDVTAAGPETSLRAIHEQLSKLGHSRAVAARMTEAAVARGRRVWGSAPPEHIAAYGRAARDAGWAALRVEDLTEKTRPTLERWARNAHERWDELANELGEDYLHDFFESMLRLSSAWGNSAGYFAMTATRG
ncbi:MAG: methyltransferase domain-containing protein [Deltaproteobacteria bacterium]|nr:methyltransferase domain-containing protein [Deltaproteobacteria bacterium]